MVDEVLRWSAFCGGILTIVALAKPIVKFFKSMRDDLTLLKAHDEEQYLSLLRLTIMSHEMPISERIIAGKKYLAKGGNGDVRKYIEEHLKPHDKSVDE